VIVGIGVDVVDLGRFDRSIERTPALATRLFRADELVLGVRWHDVVVVSDDQGAPSLVLSGGARSLADSRGVSRLHLSLSHDGGVAVAYVVAEGDGRAPVDHDAHHEGADR